MARDANFAVCRSLMSGYPDRPRGRGHVSLLSFLALQLRAHAFEALKKTFAFTMLILVAGALAASGQQRPSATDGAAPTPAWALAVSGVVLDQSNAPIAGANITLHGASADNPPSTITDAAGKFQFDGVASDSYEIEVQRDGFEDSKIHLQVGTRPIAPLRIVLQLAAVHQEITVADQQSSGQVSSDVGENADVVRLDSQALNSLPIIGNDVVGAITRMAGTGPGNVTLIVDGIPTSDLGVPVSEIQEVKINQNPYAAEFSAPGQNRIEIITKVGSKHYHGSFDSELRDYLFDARNAFAVERPQESHINLDWYLSGPLGQSGKTTFSISGERVDDNAVAVVNALTTTGPIHENFATPERSIFLSGRINREFSHANTFSLRYNFFDWSETGEGVGGFALPETAVNSTSRKNYVFVSDRTVFTSNLVNDFSARISASDGYTLSSLPGTPGIDVLGAFTGGGAQQDKHQTQTNFQLNEILSWSHGRHVIKAGVNIPTLDRWGLNDRSNFDGTFQFSSLQDYLAAKPFSFVQQLGNGHLNFWQEELSGFVQDEVRVRSDFSLAFGLRYDWQNYVSNLKNFAPRFSFAYAPGKDKKTVIRAGAGIFYQTTGAGAITDTLRYNGQTLDQIVVSNPGYPDPFALGGVAQSMPSALVRFAPDLRLPYIAQYSFGIERQLQKSTVLTVSYVGQEGYHLFLSRDINAPLAPLFMERPDPSISTLRQIESSGSLTSDSLKVSLNGKISSFFTGRVQYTWARSYDDTGGINWFPANQYDMSGEWARSNNDARHSASFYGTFHAAKLFDVGAVMSARSGLPYTITTGTDVYGTTFANARPAGVARNTMQGPGFLSLDLRLSKEFSLRGFGEKKEQAGKITTRISLDAFNVLNHVNFGQPVGDLSSPFFGTSISADSPRRLQLSMGLEF